MTGTASGAPPDPLECLISGERTSHLVIAARALTARQRVVIRMRYVDERTWSQIGIALHVSEPAAIGIHTRAIAMLRRLLETGI
jgi:DNA-directed RNA polymerase specialized sigma subunit